MGPLASTCREIIISGSCEFPDALPEIARLTFWDITSAPEFAPHLLSMEFLRGEPSTVGACWDERRTFQGGEVVLRKTIARIEEEPCCAINAGVEIMKASRLVPWGSQTFTFLIKPTDDSSDGSKSPSCAIDWTIAFLPSDICSKMLSWCCRSPFKAAFSAQVKEKMGYCHVEAL